MHGFKYTIIKLQLFLHLIYLDCKYTKSLIYFFKPVDFFLLRVMKISVLIFYLFEDRGKNHDGKPVQLYEHLFVMLKALTPNDLINRRKTKSKQG